MQPLSDGEKINIDMSSVDRRLMRIKWLSLAFMKTNYRICYNLGPRG